ncbi:hypothetical protein [Pseudomonas sp. ANT_H12B]|uniref:hypothetical protein n=1 Tax=Pseudomonas sp. ANT_H12B TaxID=2597348 RepID=UPI0011EBA6AE|nr:hypothetical protein [Pseudomonas sp. ANT_H12B]KAA0974851.1 hypothetical protein FQ185_09665 [Pseudomonas sp. ANT_H12B]
MTQTFGGQTSDTASGSFNIPTPTLTVTEPAANQKVGLLPVFKGTNGYAGARLTIHDAMSHAELGGLTLDSSGAWSVPIEIELAVGIRTIYVVQSFNGQLSLRSEQRTFEVIILIPTVTVPALNGRFERQGVIIGQGIAGAFVAVYLVGSSEIVAENIPVDEHGAWAAPTRLKEVGSHTLLVNQVYKNQLSDVAIHAFTLVPAPPLLESPAAGQGISGSTVASGFGFAGDTLKLFRRGGSGPSSLGSTVVTPEGTWSLAFTWGANWQQYSLSAQSSQQEQQSAHSPLRPVLTRSAAPSITEPAPMVWVGAAPTFAGTGREGATVTVASWFNRLEVLATTTVLPGGHWTTVATKNLLPGQHRVVVRQTENEVDSAEVMSDLFIVE